MTNKKKTYLTPEMKVVEIDQADIIATSVGGTFQSYEEDDTFNGNW